jgi:uncharacterized RmlC-like cupin family protein
MGMNIDTGHAAIVQGGARFTSEQGSDYAPGVSAETVGAQNIFLGVVTLPPGKRTKAHTHERHETAMYFLSGETVDLYTGVDLEKHDVLRPGDYMYIPVNVLHVAVNRSNAPAVFVGTRNEATVNESVVLYPDKDALID